MIITTAWQVKQAWQHEQSRSKHGVEPMHLQAQDTLDWSVYAGTTPGLPARMSSRTESLSPFVSSVDSTTVYLQAVLFDWIEQLPGKCNHETGTGEANGNQPDEVHLERSPSPVHSNTL